MARRTKSEEPQTANLSEPEARQAIPKLQRRIRELKELDVERLEEHSYEAVLIGLVHKIDATLVDVFGHNTVEYNRYAIYHLDDTSVGISWGRSEPSDSIYHHRAGISSAVGSAIANLQAAVDSLSERIEPEHAGGPAKIIRAYEGLELHIEIARAASKLFKDGYYSNAVEAAVKALNGLVRLRSGLEIDGTTLMEHAFSPKKPVLRFNDLSDKSDEDEQTGFMLLFKGAVAGLRNPRAHSFINDEPERALEFIAFVSLLAKLLDEASTV